ncbi:DUF1488 family protein [Salinivibrio sp. MA607]|uniref:DUF1488 family protein n=1 Tax=Salinivibrio sp. MA607 TaxID=1909457 RepID=UPI0009896F91|nr:DUF1488 family protein [Salinivibrio sp. MA607]OOF04311.1 hypothetical protein BZG81_09785 [Salinivibrio sp. MA607]
MNQSLILAADEAQVDTAKARVCFYGQLNGALLTCAVRFTTLSALAGCAVDSNNAQAIVEQVWFDIEEQMEAAIESEAFEPDGSLVI